MKSALQIVTVVMLASLLPGQVTILPGGCPGPDPLLNASASRAVVGMDFSVTVNTPHNYPGNRILVAWGNHTDTTWRGCRLRVMPLGVWDQTPPVLQSTKTVHITVPTDPTLVGIKVYLQAVMDGGLLGFDLSAGIEVEVERTLTMPVIPLKTST